MTLCRWGGIIGLVKIDLLGLRMLSAIADALMLVEQGRGQAVALDDLDFRDRSVTLNEGDFSLWNGQRPR